MLFLLVAGGVIVCCVGGVMAYLLSAAPNFRRERDKLSDDVQPIGVLPDVKIRSGVASPRDYLAN